MTIHRHVLEGCAPTPLAHYLKALGILRLVSEQKDDACRGAWHNDHFVLATVLSREELERFFLGEYRPTPIVDPWNGGSGFYPKDNKKGLDALVRCDDRRLQGLKDVVDWTKDAVAEWQEAPADETKTAFQSRCRAAWRGSAADALAAAVVLGSRLDGGRATIRAMYPALLGTGWNDGRLDFANNFHQRLADIFDLSRKHEKGPDKEAAASKDARTKVKGLLNAALWATIESGLKKTAIGQFLPNSAGGPNSSTGADGDSLVNPWDFVLSLEGTLLLSSSATRRLGPAAIVQASSPFALHNQATGPATMSGAEESDRGEQWMPIWNRLVGLPELKALLSEGRAQIGVSVATRPVDMGRAVARLGVTRGISGFQRYGYLERNGQAKFAVPCGFVSVVARPRTRIVDDIATWLDRLHRQARDKGAPSRLVQVERTVADATFAALTHDDSPSLWQDVARACAAVEQIQAGGTALKAGPIPRLSPEWLRACDDASPEFRLALALGSAAGNFARDGRPIDPIRHHWLPLEGGNPRKFALSDGRLRNDVRVVAHGRDPEADLLAILERRTIEATQRGTRQPMLVAPEGAAAGLADLAAWLEGTLDIWKCIELARVFMAVDWTRWSPQQVAVSETPSRNVPDEAWSTLRLNALPWPLDGDRDIPLDPAIVRRLGSGDVPEAVRLALQRLGAHGIHPTVRSGFGDAALSRRWGSALAFPISRRTALRLLHQLQPETKETHHVR